MSPILIVDVNKKTVVLSDTTIDESAEELQNALKLSIARLTESDTFEQLSSLAASPEEDISGLTDSQIRKMLKYEKNPMRIKQLNKMLSGKKIGERRRS